ncbi:MAG: AAA family ATPase [Bacteroidota bacterium]
MLKRVAIIGPESTGKSWLAQKLAAHYNTKVTDEYSRIYFKNREYNYTVDNLAEIAKGQLKYENDIANSCTDLIFCDTEFIVMKIWSQVVFNFVPDWIENQIVNHTYNLYLLCNLDVDWEPDALRNNSHNRQYIYNLFVKELGQNNFNYRVVKDIDDNRLENAIKFVDELMNNELSLGM